MTKSSQASKQQSTSWKPLGPPATWMFLKTEEEMFLTNWQFMSEDTEVEVMVIPFPQEELEEGLDQIQKKNHQDLTA